MLMAVELVVSSCLREGCIVVSEVAPTMCSDIVWNVALSKPDWRGKNQCDQAQGPRKVTKQHGNYKRAAWSEWPRHDGRFGFSNEMCAHI